MSRRLDIIVLSGASEGDVFHFNLAPASSVVIGRAPSCDLVLQDPLVSREHAALEFADDSFFIVDRGSTHGTVHMGFKLKPGSEGRRALKDGDEFKIGEALFRVAFPDEREPAQPIEVEPTAEYVPKEKRSFFFDVQELKKGKRPIYAILLLVIVLLLLIPVDDAPKLPKQKSKQVITLPEWRLVGYWPGGKTTSKKNQDTSHLDKAQFGLPASDLVVEFDYISESPVEVYVDRVLVEALKPHTGTWQHRQLIVRDVALGRERRLVFDNKDYPRKGKTSKKFKRWAVRNVRGAPITRQLEPGDESGLVGQAISLVSRIDTTPDALFAAIRSLQKCVLEALGELSLDAVGFAMELDTGEQAGGLDPEGLVEQLRAIQREQGGLDVDTSNRHLEAFVEMTQGLDSELWRRIKSRVGRARYSSQAKNYIVAHDNLVAVKRMFPEEADYRWTLADRMFRNTKIVPKKVRKNPGRYRGNF